jgi:hypothetical protein
MEEDFYATVKFKNGEEIFAKVMISEESEKTFLILSNPIILIEVKNKSEVIGYKIEPWLKTTKEDMFIVNVDDVLTISESFDIDMISMYQTYLRQVSKENNNQSKISKKMGYISNVNDAKEILEKIFKEY